MAWRDFLSVFRRSVIRRSQDDRDLDDEFRFHLAEETRLLTERGKSLEDARQTAKRAFGSVTLAKESTRAVWISTATEQFFQDVRFGWRIFRSAPGLSATAVLLIALVIGGNTTVFSIAHGILAKPAPGVTAPRLVTLSWIDDKGHIEPINSYVAYDAFRRNSTRLERLLGWDNDRATLNHDNGSYAIQRAFVSPNYFETLGAHFERGRSFTEREADSGAYGLMVVISHYTWVSSFQSQEDIIGTAVMLNGQPATIIGVVAAPFRGSLLVPPADVWVPLSTLSTTQSAGRPHPNRSDIGVAMIGRLAPGVSIAQAHAELSALWSQAQAAHPNLPQNLKLTLVRYSANAGGNSLVSARGGTFLAIFSIVTVMTLLIVCANVANLLVARAAIRQRELSLRQSLGASRVRIVRAQLAEGLALSVVAWITACLFAWGTTKAVSGFFAPPTQGMATMPDFTPDWTVIGYALLLAIACTVACSFAPALRACRQQLLPSLKAGEQAVIPGRSKLTNGLVILQLAFSVLLVTSAGLAYRSMFLIGDFDSGFDTHDLLLVTVNTSASAKTPATNIALLETATDKLHQVPGVVRVTYARSVPREFWPSIPITRPGEPQEVLRAESTRVGPGYLSVFSAAPVVGRDFAREDQRRSTHAILISQNLADRLWPAQSPLGRTLIINKQEREVAGVMPNLFLSGFRREHPGFVMLSAQQEPFEPGEATLYVRYSGALDTIGPAITRALRQVDAHTPVAYMRTWDTQLDSAIWPIRVLTTLLMLFAGGSLFIAAIGQYAVVAFDMRRRVREVGLRMALGASSRQVLTRVMREGFALTVIGLLLGFLLSLGVGTVLGAALYGITATDPMTYAGVFALLSAASLLACYLPARQAARINPMTALRVE
jgi:predicted permease